MDTVCYIQRDVVEMGLWGSYGWSMKGPTMHVIVFSKTQRGLDKESKGWSGDANDLGNDKLSQINSLSLNLYLSLVNFKEYCNSCEEEKYWSLDKYKYLSEKIKSEFILICTKWPLTIFVNFRIANQNILF